MKCDELKRKYSDITGPYYGYNEVNEAIAELKVKLSEKDKELESLKASHYAEMVDAGMRERRLRRALYIVLARLFCCMRELAARNALYDDECKWDNFKTTCLKKAEEYK